jgi:hypothetical protein
MKKRLFASLILAGSLILCFLSCSKKYEQSRDESLLEKSTLKTANCGVNELNLNMIVPAYFNGYSPYWDTLINNASQMPGKIYAIMNAFNGPWPAFDSVLKARITDFRNAGGKILVYVNTYNYPSVPRPIDSVKLEVDTWYSWYGPEVDGVFYDQMYPATGGLESFYRELYLHAKMVDCDGLVVGNPGAHTSETYLNWNGNRVTDVLCTFENVVGEISNWTPQPWQDNYTRDRFYFLIHTAPGTEDMYYSLNEALARGYGWFYCTDRLMPNPWDGVSAYMNEMTRAVKAVHNGTYPAITVDGNVNDWATVLPLATGTTTVQTFKMANSDTTLHFLVQGTGLNVTSNIYLNTDNDRNTGYAPSVWRWPNGCDFMIENNVVYQNIGGGWSWNPVATLTASQFYRDDNVIEIAVPLSVLGITNDAFIHAGFIKNSSGDQLPKPGASMIFRALYH